MINTVFFYSVVMLIGVFIASISQVFLKSAALKKHESVIKEYLNAKVIFAYVLFFVSTVLSIISYRGISLSMGAVLGATGYVFVTAFGIIIFKEKLTLAKTIALVCILAGVIIYAT